MTTPAPFSAYASFPDDATAVLRISGDLDLATLDQLRAHVDAALDGRPGATLVLEMSALRFVDSTGIRTLLDLRSARLADAGRFVLRAPTPAVRRVLELMALDQLIEIED